MTRLRVRIRNSMYDRRSRYDSAANIKEYSEYEGDVYPNPPWVTSDSFCLTTGDAQFPFRILSKEDIIHGWLLPQSRVAFPSEIPASKTYQVQSKGKTYLVTRTGNKLSCNCTGFSYRRTCSHIKEITNV